VLHQHPADHGADGKNAKGLPSLIVGA
jgi:hypothetical protein